MGVSAMSDDRQTFKLQGSWGYENVREIVTELRHEGFSVDAKRTSGNWVISAERNGAAMTLTLEATEDDPLEKMAKQRDHWRREVDELVEALATLSAACQSAAPGTPQAMREALTLAEAVLNSPATRGNTGSDTRKLWEVAEAAREVVKWHRESGARWPGHPELGLLMDDLEHKVIAWQEV